MNKKIIYILTLLLIILAFPGKLRAECVEIAGDVVETQLEMDVTGMKPGETKEVGTGLAKVTYKLEGYDSSGRPVISYEGGINDAKSYNMDSVKTDKNAYYDGKKSNTHSGDTTNAKIGDDKFADMKIGANGEISGSGKTSSGTQKEMLEE